MVHGAWFQKNHCKARAQNLSRAINPKGFTLLETLSATGIAAIIITSALSVIASVYFSQRKVQFSHDFFAEARFMMERIAQTTRNNTIDYDRYFVQYGPPAADCGAFVVGVNGQVPQGHITATNDQTNRNTLGYPTIFYWDTNGDQIPDRNLGGVTPTGGTVDGCTKSMGESDTVRSLFLINSGRTVRTHIRHDDTAGELKVAMTRQLGADTDGDGLADAWGPFDANGNGVFEASNGDIELVWTGAECQLHVNVNADASYQSPDEEFPVMGEPASEEWCDQAHVEESISPVALQVNDLQFDPNPVFDPYLAFRNDNAQVHPHVYITMDVQLRNPDRYGFEVGEEPVINFQTAVSSRVFGDIRR